MKLSPISRSMSAPRLFAKLPFIDAKASHPRYIPHRVSCQETQSLALASVDASSRSCVAVPQWRIPDSSLEPNSSDWNGRCHPFPPLRGRGGLHRIQVEMDGPFEGRERADSQRLSESFDSSMIIRASR